MREWDGDLVGRVVVKERRRHIKEETRDEQNVFENI